MNQRLRLVRMHIRPEVVVDDGETLTPLDVEPKTLSPAEWATFRADGWEVALEALAAEVIKPDAPPET
jgi:hypothetical protein